MTEYSADKISNQRTQYWRRNIQYLLILLTVWFI
ncbi:uncharacterized protein METZ01_LOCUS116230, partial [marine metagenome]